MIFTHHASCEAQRVNLLHCLTVAGMVPHTVEMERYGELGPDFYFGFLILAGLTLKLLGFTYEKSKFMIDSSYQNGSERSLLRSSAQSRRSLMKRQRCSIAAEGGEVSSHKMVSSFKTIEHRTYDGIHQCRWYHVEEVCF